LWLGEKGLYASSAYLSIAFISISRRVKLKIEGQSTFGLCDPATLRRGRGVKDPIILIVSIERVGVCPVVAEDDCTVFLVRV
jgi:hypothetical protein